MDTDVDHIKQSREEFLGANEEEFLEYLKGEGVTVFFAWGTYRATKRRAIDALRDMFWAEYLDSLEHSFNVDREQKLK